VPDASPRIKLVLFHAIMWTIVALPLLAAAVVLSVSVIAYDILRHPERHQNTRRIWNVIASDLYFEYEANLWQNQKDCVQYDDKLLYKPSSGCRFANKEFSTDLTFSEDGRVTTPSRAPTSRRPLIFAGDSETMGWGVNDGETFASLIAASIEAPVLNLGVASYGTVREIMRVRMQPRFQDANCIVIQYSWNDFDENSVFLARGALPSPTRKRFQQLVSDYGKRDVSFQDVLIRTFDLMLNYPFAVFLNVIGWHDFPLEDDDPMNMNGTPREETEDTKAFLAVLASFPELNGKKIFVMGPGRFISALSRETAPANVFLIPVDLNDGDWYTLDMHPNKEGHRQMAAQILEQLKRTDEGRQCLAGEP
jgi:lysophospholipase L1-like esterase